MIFKHYRWRIPAFLEISHYSQTHLSRILHKYFDMGLHDYILTIRLETAYNDLVLTSKALEEISESIGYNSFSHFNKIFKKKYGITPAALRKEHGKPTIWMFCKFGTFTKFFANNAPLYRKKYTLSAWRRTAWII